jgi:serine/threonine-protein kinase
MLPGGHAVLYTVLAAKGGLGAASIVLLDTRTGQQTTVLRGGTHGQYTPNGQLMYAAAGTLRATKFDLTNRIASGPSALVVPQALMYPTGAIEAALARDGTLAYVTGGPGGALRTLVWVDRQGQETQTGAPPRAYISPRISPDGTRVATVVVGGKGDIWTWDFARLTLMPLTLEPAIHGNPVWTSDGRMVFSSDVAGAINIFKKAADGSGGIDRLTDSPNAQNPSDFAPDGTLLFTERSSTTGSDVMALPMNAARQVVPLVQTPFDERNGVVSPDGRWLAYDANDTGTFEIYVRPFPDVTRGHWLVSTNGGIQPLWSHSGQELFYLAGDGALMRVAVGSGPAWSAGPPAKVLEGRYVVNVGNQGRNYDITADGQRFLMMKANGTSEVPPQIIVVQHFDEELKRLVPTK